MQRRDFLKYSLLGGLASTLPLSACQMLAKPESAAKFSRSQQANRPKVVVVGAGFAGATCAKYISAWSQGGVDVKVIEPNGQFISCPLSNLVLSGSKNIQQLTFSYRNLQHDYPIEWVRDRVEAIDVQKRLVKTPHHQFAYDKLVLAPGISLIQDQLPGYSAALSQQSMPHAWKAGAQTELLYKQIQAMPTGGVFVISIPKAPYRCPPGPYERVCQVAFYMSRFNPTGKIIVLDANPEIVSKKALFTQVWQQYYPQLIDYRPNSPLQQVDSQILSVSSEFETVSADVLNIIPPQKAGQLAAMAGLIDQKQAWVEVDFVSYASRRQADIHVIGDAVSANLPKSAHIATSQARVCAAAIVALLQNQAPDAQPVFANTCYSFIDDQRAMHVAHVYRYDEAKKIMQAAEGGGVSAAPSKLEGDYAYAWANNIWADVLV